jgi:hypothetical protein
MCVCLLEMRDDENNRFWFKIHCNNFSAFSSLFPPIPLFFEGVVRLRVVWGNWHWQRLQSRNRSEGTRTYYIMREWGLKAKGPNPSLHLHCTHTH